MGASVTPSGQPSQRRGRRRRSRVAVPMSEINVTPFVDVMLVLLIIFMVAAPLLTVGVPIELPETAATPLPLDEEDPLTITLATDGSVLIQTTVIETDALIPRLQAIAAERDNDQLYLRADGAIPYERVMQVMGALNAAGFTKIGLVTDPGGPSFGGVAGQ
ncbi:protein TolR [Pseudoruegeria sp. SK021]|uniref:protein TolR n=1 Tax=Pseudoruegeria sp. SK021 TaxID=1933035 RepID=UPI000A256601|nr:protein TolR [Pseudoruegeria sp. SK021]OSP56536.1 protein TolR [Pseudoruegeria sp. SK021]